MFYSELFVFFDILQIQAFIFKLFKFWFISIKN